MIRDNIQSITKGNIRRLARRGGVKRISGAIYEDVRTVLKARLEEILKTVVEILGEFASSQYQRQESGILTLTSSRTEYKKRKTVSTPDVVFALKRLGSTVYVSDFSPV